MGERVYGLAAISVVFVCSLIWHWIRMPAHPSDQVVYLVPSDVTPKPEFADGARRAVIAAQRWYFDDLKSGVTFTLADPLVITVQTRHPESRYSSRGRERERSREALVRRGGRGFRTHRRCL